MTEKKKKLLIAGGTGLLGKRIIKLLDHSKYDIIVLTRSSKDSDEVDYKLWDIDKGIIDPAAVKDVDYAINLSGAGIADKKWTDARKKIIINSRTKGAELLMTALNKESPQLKAYVSASAIGIYGDRGDEIITSKSDIDTNQFLGETTRLWEDAVSESTGSIKRVVIIRLGVILSILGGALQKFVGPAKFGSVAYFGNGKQYFPWIHIDDAARIFISAIENDAMSGVYNGVAPEPIQMKDFSKALAKAMGGLKIVHSVPRAAIKLMLGKRSALVLNSARIIPDRLNEWGFKFSYTDATKALKDLIGRNI